MVMGLVMLEVVGMVVLETGWGLKVAMVLQRVVVVVMVMVFGVMVPVVMVKAVDVAMEMVEGMGWMWGL